MLEELRAGGLALGGEQSGHIVMPAYATTGDGVLTGLHLMARMAATGKSLADLASVMHKLPQVLINVRVADRAAGAAAPTVLAAVAVAEDELGETGRVLLRPSGTEPLVRVMVEAATVEQRPTSPSGSPTWSAPRARPASTASCTAGSPTRAGRRSAFLT